MVVFPTRTFTFCKYRLVLRVLQVCDSLLSTDVGASTSLRSFCCISTDIFLIYSALVQIAAVFVKIFFSDVAFVVVTAENYILPTSKAL